MTASLKKTDTLLTYIIAALASFSSVGGLLFDGLYHDNLFVTSAWRGNDLITLFIAVPLLLSAWAWARRGSLRGELVWIGCLDYMLYNFAFYLFGARFNAFFLIYTALLGLSIFALIFGMIGLDLTAIASGASARMPVRLISGYMFFIAAMLSIVYVSQSILFIVKDSLPTIVTVSDHPTSVVFALDLTLLVPVLVLGGVWLLQRKPWGFALAAMILVKGALYTLVLTAGSLSAKMSGIPGAGAEIPLWGGLTIAGLIACLLFYSNHSDSLNPKQR
ncbi:hypothetical protein LWX53_06480 [bacterium]|nr:hypothetical protein [bacterium]